MSDQTTYDKVNELVRRQRNLKNAIRGHASQMLELLLDDIEEIELSYTNKERLAELKKKLKRFNSVTGEWKR